MIFENKKSALGNFTISEIPSSYANAMLVTGNFYLSQYHDSKKALEWFQKAVTVDPNYDKNYSAIGVYYLTSEKSCTAAKGNFLKAIDLKSVEPLNYFLLYITYKDCIKDFNSAEEVRKRFEKQFQTTFPKKF